MGERHMAKTMAMNSTILAAVKGWHGAARMFSSPCYTIANGDTEATPGYHVAPGGGGQRGYSLRTARRTRFLFLVCWTSPLGSSGWSFNRNDTISERLREL